jgi:hypothetical protein
VRPAEPLADCEFANIMPAAAAMTMVRIKALRFTGRRASGLAVGSSGPGTGR